MNQGLTRLNEEGACCTSDGTQEVNKKDIGEADNADSAVLPEVQRCNS